MAALRFEQGQARDKVAAGCPLPKDFVGGLGIQVDQARPLFDGDQVIGGLAVRVVAFGQPHGDAGQQQLPAAAGVFDVYGDRLVLDQDLGHKAVGAGDKDRRGDIGVAQGSSLLSEMGGK